jgi:hypothetical protein
MALSESEGQGERAQYRRYARLDQRQQPAVGSADETISADLGRGEGLLDMR